MNNPVLILYLEDDPRDAELVRDKLQQTPPGLRTAGRERSRGIRGRAGPDTF
jgi:hypothetical protein